MKPAPKQTTKQAPPAQPKKEEQQLARRDEQQLATMADAPAFLKHAQAETVGLNNMGRGDITMPRLAMCQSNTPQRKKADPKYIEGLSEGDYFNTVTGENHGGRLLFVPVHFYKSRILFKDLDEGGGILCQAPNALEGQGEPGGECARCPMAQFSKDERPACHLFMNWFIVVMDTLKDRPTIDKMIVLSFKSTGLKAAKDLNSLMRQRKAAGYNSFASVMELTSVPQKNQYGEFYVPVMKPAGWIQTKEQEADFLQLYNIVAEFEAAGRVRVDDVEGINEEQQTANQEM